MGGSLNLDLFFRSPKIVRHPRTKDPERDPNLENYPNLQEESGSWRACIALLPRAEAELSYCRRLNLTIGIGFWGPVYYEYSQEPPPPSPKHCIGNY